MVDDATGCAVVVEGRLDSPSGGAAGVLAAYLRWGEGLAQHLRGEFAIAIWDPREQMLLLLRDPFGVKHLYFARAGDRLVFTSTPQQLLSGAGISAEVSEDVLLWYLYGGSPAPERRTFYERIGLLPGGHRLRAKAGVVEVSRYWDWPAHPPQDVLETPDAIASFRSEFKEAVRARMPRDERIAVFLSGGLDSGAVAAVAGEVRGHDASRDVALYSLVFDELTALDERTYSAAVAGHASLDQTLVPADDHWALAHLERWLPHFVEPFMGASDAALHALMDRARQDGADRILFGHGGDHLVTGSPRYLADWLLRGRLAGVIGQVRGQVAAGHGSFGRRFAVSALLPLAPPGVQRFLEHRNAFPRRKWIPAGLAGAHGVDRPGPTYTGPKAWWYALRDGFAGFGQLPLSAHDGMLRSFGLEHGNPFLDVRLVELVLRVRPEALYRDGMTKMLLRDALGDTLPATLRQRRDKTIMSALLHRGLRERRRDFVHALVADSELERRGYVVPGPWKEMVGEYLAGNDALAAQCWISLTAELWLRNLEGRVPGLQH